MAVKILLRRDTTFNWNFNNPILGNGELGVEIVGNERKIKIGDGVKSWTQLDYLIDGAEYRLLEGGIPLNDLSLEVRNKLSLADTALQTETDPVYLQDKPTIALKSEIPNVSGLISAHNTDSNSHQDIRQSVENIDLSDYYTIDEVNDLFESIEVGNLSISDVNNLQSLLDGKSNNGHTHTKSNITDFAHTHSISDTTNLQSYLDGKAASSHTHSIGNVTNLQTTLNGKSDTGHTHTKSNITDFAHTHSISDTTNLQSSLDGKAASSHTHSIGNVTNLQSLLDGKSNNGHTHTKSNITDFAHTHSISDTTNLQGTLNEMVVTYQISPSSLNLQNANAPRSGIYTIDNGSSLGLGVGWWHIIQMRHYHNNGYNAQLAFRLDDINMTPRYRLSVGTTWSTWKELGISAGADKEFHIGVYVKATLYYLPFAPNFGDIVKIFVPNSGYPDCIKEIRVCSTNQSIPAGYIALSGQWIYRGNDGLTQKIAG